MRLLVLLWIWALCVFMVVDLFLNVREFDRVRPRAPLYSAMRQVAHEMVGEPLPDEGVANATLPSTARTGSARACLVPRMQQSGTDDGQMQHRPSTFQDPAWKMRLVVPVRRAADLMEMLGATWALGHLLQEPSDEDAGTDDVIYPRAKSIRAGAFLAGKRVFNEGGTLHVVGSVGQRAELQLVESGGLVVTDSMEGSVTMRDGAVYVGRDLTGTLKASASVVLLVEGNLTGDVAVGDSSTVFVRGSVTGHLRVGRGDRCRVFLAERLPHEALEAMPGNYEGCVLNVPELLGFTDGSHDVRIGSWKRIVVGGEVWDEVR